MTGRTRPEDSGNDVVSPGFDVRGIGSSQDDRVASESRR